MARKVELVAIHGGGDWYDASARYLKVPLSVDIVEANKAWRKWYDGEYIRLYDSPDRPAYMNIEEFLVLHYGAVDATEDDIEIYEDL